MRFTLKSGNDIEHVGNYNKTQYSFLYYVPFYIIRDFFLNKAPIQIPLHFSNKGYNSILVVGKTNTLFGYKIKIIETGNIATNIRGTYNPFTHIKEFFTGINIVNNFKPDIAIFQGNYPTNILIVGIIKVFYLFKRQKNGKFKLKLDWDGEFKSYPIILRFLYAINLLIAAKLFDEITIETECAYERVKPMPIVGKKLKFIPNAISDEFFPVKPYFNGKRENLIISVTRVTESKGIDSLIKLFSESIKVVPNWKLTIIGPISEKSYYEKLKDTIRKLELENKIFFSGKLLGEKLYNYYSLASIFCLLSKGESFALARSEAIASGIPVLTTNAACGEKFKGGINVPYEDFEAQKIALISLMQSTELRIRLVEEGQKHIRSWDEIMKQL